MLFFPLLSINLVLLQFLMKLPANLQILYFYLLSKANSYFIWHWLSVNFGPFLQLYRVRCFTLVVPRPTVQVPFSTNTHCSCSQEYGGSSFLWFSHSHTSVCFAHFFHTLTCFYSLLHTLFITISSSASASIYGCVCVCSIPGFSRVVAAAVASWDCVPLPLGLYCGQGRF